MTSIRRLSTDSATRKEEEYASRQRREVFGDCALIEIIHLHDCLRGAVKTLKTDVQTLAHCLLHRPHSNSDDDNGQSPATTKDSVVTDLEGRVFGRFQVIWSVFRAHSSAEDEFIWPALRKKTQPLAPATTSTTIPLDDEEEEGTAVHASSCETTSPHHNNRTSNSSSSNSSGRARQAPDNLVQEEYEEDHADEERMFSEMDSLLGRLKEGLNQEKAVAAGGSSTGTRERPASLANRIMEQTQRLSNHLLKHLEKEELHCMPLVLQHLDKAEIHDLVGQIMGRRSADTITNIMTMAVQSLDTEEREEMIKYMKQSMQNTFFDQWLLASGWGSSSPVDSTEDGAAAAAVAGSASSESASSIQPGTENPPPEDRKRSSLPSAHTGDHHSPVSEKRARVAITTQAELERLIRGIATNQALSSHQKNTTIQGLRDSVWKQNQQVKQRQNGSPPAVAVNVPLPFGLPLLSQTSASAAASTPCLRVATVGPTVQSCSLPPAKYFKKNEEGTLEMVWSSGAPTSNPLPTDGSVPTFSASELAPTFHDGVAGAVFGCPHYSRACKLRHPKSGRLYTCRLCCDHQRELPMREDEPLDRYAVTEVMCMKCTAVQPASDRCINPDCESSHKSFARYFCRICHLYDDGSRPIFHCPYCNTCRLGHGLGIDYRHCMRCNACVSLSDKEHRCIPQKLQGDCPICHEALFQSTEPLRGVKCGHVMHLSCFTQYRRNRYTCPLCCKSMEDMKDHFAMLDAAIRMQPMPVTFLNTTSSIYCQDCGKTGQVPFHFVGMKCPTCSSYNTREITRETTS